MLFRLAPRSLAYAGHAQCGDMVSKSTTAAALCRVVFCVMRRKELELERTQTHMAQKPVIRVEVDALGAHQLRNRRGVAFGRRRCATRLCGWVWVGILAPAGPLTDVVFELDTVF